MSLEAKLEKLNNMIEHGAHPEEVQKFMDEMAAERKAGREGDDLPEDMPQEVRDHINDLRSKGHNVKVKVVSKEFETEESMKDFLKEMHQEHMKTCKNCRDKFEAEQAKGNDMPFGKVVIEEVNDSERKPLGWMIFNENRPQGTLFGTKEEAETALKQALEHPLAKIASALGAVPPFEIRPVFGD